MPDVSNTMKVYRFRSLGDCQFLERAEQILTTGKFWCSRFWELNDPMEGIYIQRGATGPTPILLETFKAKTDQLVCCFSAEDALKDPLMWGYYANGFKGVAIEIEVCSNDVEKICYCEDLQCPDGRVADRTARRILCRKLPGWAHEREYRFLTDNGSNSQKIGTITGLVVGYSYPRTAARLRGDKRLAKVEDYCCRARQLIDVAESKGVKTYMAQMKNGSIDVKKMSYKALRTALLP